MPRSHMSKEAARSVNIKQFFWKKAGMLIAARKLNADRKIEVTSMPTDFCLVMVILFLCLNTEIPPKL